MEFVDLEARVDRHSRRAELLELLAQLIESREEYPDWPIMVTRTMRGIRANLGSGGIDVDRVLLQDLASWGLVQRSHLGRASEQLIVPADVVAFYTWYQERHGTPIDVVEDEVMRLVEGEGFAQRHPTAAKALGEAFALLQRGVVDVADVAEVGQHLRGALTDVVQASAVLPAPNENVQRATKPARKAAVERGDAAVEALITLAERVMDLDQGLTHARDEQAEGRAVADGETVRRAAFLTAVVCFELDRTPIRP
jgi:hypothetical protein